MSELTEQSVREMTDEQVVSATYTNVHGAAFFSRVTHYDRNCDLLWKEAGRRGKPELYERGYKQAEGGLL